MAFIEMFPYTLYPDQIWMLVGWAGAFLSVLLMLYLFLSYRKSRLYKRILRGETEQFDVLRTTWLTAAAATGSSAYSSNPSTGSSASGNYHSTVLLTVNHKTGIDESGNDESGIDESGTQLMTVDDEGQAFVTADALSAGTGNDTVGDTNAETTPGIRIPLKPVTAFDAAVLEGQYILLGEMNPGGMSRIFLARKINTGNIWIIKFIPHKLGTLTNEADILKQLNHKSLPKIIDIFRDDKGIYIVESFIEGVSLDKVLSDSQPINEFILLDWAEQLTRVLHYLHQMKPHPILHLDLKPSNIMVTRDNELMLIDFGISKQQEEVSEVMAATVAYAAPEQLKKKLSENASQIIRERFGTLPEARAAWRLDERTDLYSLGVVLFEMAVGLILTVNNQHLLKSVVSSGLAKIITRCAAVDPSERYSSAEELLRDLQRQKNARTKMVKSLLIRRLTVVASAIGVMVTCGGFAFGNYLGQREALAAISVTPEIITVSVQQSSEMQIQKTWPDDSAEPLEPSRLSWDYTANRIAQVDGSRVVGLNAGETVVNGTYRGKEISVKINVVEPLEGEIDILQWYRPGHTASVFAGTANREHLDGSLAEAEFVSPESMDIAADGSVYIADSGHLRRITNGNVYTVTFNPPYLTPHIVRCYENDVYVLTDAWEEEDGYYYGLIRISDGMAEGIYITDARYTAVLDFFVACDSESGGEYIYFLEHNAGLDSTWIKRINLNDTADIYTLCQTADGVTSMAFDGTNIYVADEERGLLMVYEDGQFYNLAGAEEGRGIIDGAAPLFFMPTKIKYAFGQLYVWDFNVLRRISLTDSLDSSMNLVNDAITLVGVAAPDYSMEILAESEAAEDIVLPYSRLMDFLVTEDGVLLTDPKRGVIWFVD